MATNAKAVGNLKEPGRSTRRNSNAAVAFEAEVAALRGLHVNLDELLFGENVAHHAIHATLKRNAVVAPDGPVSGCGVVLAYHDCGAAGANAAPFLGSTVKSDPWCHHVILCLAYLFGVHGDDSHDGDRKSVV